MSLLSKENKNMRKRFILKYNLVILLIIFVLIGVFSFSKTTFADIIAGLLDLVKIEII